MTLYILLFLVLFAASAFFSSSEMAISSANEIRLKNLAEEGSKAAKRTLFLLDHFDRTLSTLLIGNNLANIGMSSLLAVIVTLLNAEKWNWLFTALLTIFVLIFCETAPKIMASINSNRIAMRASAFTIFLSYLFAPLIWLVVTLIEILLLPLRKFVKEDDSDFAVEELHNIIEIAQDENVLDDNRTELLQSALEFSDVSAADVMTARVDMDAIDIDDDLDEIKQYIDDSSYTRLPVYRDSVDNIIGILHQNHFLREMLETANPDIESLLMNAIYVYKTAKMPQVLSILRRSKTHLAIVTDEYGGTLGVITMEDVLEQLVGEIWDETDEVENEIVQRSEAVYEFDGDVIMCDFLEEFGKNEEDISCESETVGGWTIELFGDFPKEGDSIDYDNLTITVLKMDGHRVERILVVETASAEEDD